MTHMEQKIANLMKLQDKSKDLFTEFHALLELHHVAVNRNDGTKEGEIRAQMHNILDLILDITTELKGV